MIRAMPERKRFFSIEAFPKPQQQEHSKRQYQATTIGHGFNRNYETVQLVGFRMAGCYFCAQTIPADKNLRAGDWGWADGQHFVNRVPQVDVCLIPIGSLLPLCRFC